MGTETGDVRNDARILELDKCVVDDKAGEVVGVKDMEVGVSSGHGSKRWFGECAGVEGFEVLDLIFAVGAKVVGVLTNLQVPNVLGYLWPLFFVGENEGVMVAACYAPGSFSFSFTFVSCTFTSSFSRLRCSEAHWTCQLTPRIPILLFPWR